MAISMKFGRPKNCPFLSYWQTMAKFLLKLSTKPINILTIKQSD